MFLLENAFLFSSGDGGGGGTGSDDKTKDDDKGNDDKNKKGDEETITLTKAEYAEKLQQKFAEGARKAKEAPEDNKSKDGEKGKEGEKKGANEAGNDQTQLIQEIKEELEGYRGEKLALKLGIKADYTEDAIALLKGKGLAINEENIKNLITKHPGWKVSTDDDGASGVRALGSTGGETNPKAGGEKEQAAKLFGL